MEHLEVMDLLELSKAVFHFHRKHQHPNEEQKQKRFCFVPNQENLKSQLE